ncbi:MAG: AAA family ATPase, partial [Desulfitobacteriaceae bacterium]|nr:AAA family ATPase [Desulfitobacteriaceae bacterium]
MEEFYKGGVALDLQDIDDLSDDQKNALVSIKKWWNHRTTRYFAVGGVAGSGKTTLISRLAEELKLPESNVLYCAFTGKAALVMRRKGIEADTIHHGIYDAIKTIENGKISYEFVLRSLLSRSYRLIVIDESSMIGDKLWADILSFGIPVIIFGDHQQLPPVEGKLNLMENPDFKMEKVLRQLEDSPILRLASMAINGETIKFGEFGSGVIKKRAVDLVDSDFDVFSQVVVGKN